MLNGLNFKDRANITKNSGHKPNNDQTAARRVSGEADQRRRAGRAQFLED
jgi:hypothetical protein